MAEGMERRMGHWISLDGKKEPASVKWNLVQGGYRRRPALYLGMQRGSGIKRREWRQG